MALVDQLVAESDNLQAALAWLIDHDVAEAWRLAGTLEAYWYRRPVRESLRWLESAFVPRASRPAMAPRRACAPACCSILATFQPSLVETMRQMHDVLALARAGEERRITAVALAMLGNEGLITGEFGQSDAYFDEALALAQAADDKATLSTVLAERARAHATRAVTTAPPNSTRRAWRWRRPSAAPTSRPASSSALAKLALRQGDPQRAGELIEPTVPVWEALHDRVGLGTAQLAVAAPRRWKDEYDEALAVL